MLGVFQLLAVGNVGDFLISQSREPSTWYSALERPDWWVVIIAAFTGLAVAWQSFETRRAAQAMRESNQAAISTQRARLRVDLENVDREHRGRIDRSFQLVTTNFGSTIAEVIGVATKLDRFTFDQFKNLETIDMESPTHNQFSEPHLIPAGERWKFAEISIDEVIGTGFEASEVEAQKRFPAWYGWIQYRDFVGTTHRKKFFYMYSKGNQMLFELGPKGWNTED